MPQERTEEEIVGMLPIDITLGKEKYQIKLLPMLKQREWRTKLNSEMSTVLSGFGKGNPDVVGVKGGFATALIEFPEKLADLLFAYAPDLPKETILETATEEQVATAFSKLMVVAYPFLAQLALITKAIQMQAVQ